MTRPQDKTRLDGLLEEFKAQPVGWVYIDIIVSRVNFEVFARALIEGVFSINAISWWEYIADTQIPTTCGMGGPRSMFYEGWFAETCGQIDDIPHVDDPEQALSAVLQVVENKVLGDYDGKQITFKNTPSLTPAFWLGVDESWRNTQTNEEAEQGRGANALPRAAHD